MILTLIYCECTQRKASVTEKEIGTTRDIIVDVTQWSMRNESENEWTRALIS